MTIIATDENGREREFDELDLLIHQQQHQVKYLNDKLVSDAGWLIGHLQQFIARRESQDSVVNSYGVVQGSGIEIDRNCALLDAAQQTLRKLRELKKSRESTSEQNK